MNEGHLQPGKRRGNIIMLMTRHHDEALDPAVAHRPRRAPHQRLAIDLGKQFIHRTHPAGRSGGKQNAADHDIAGPPSFDHPARQRA